MPNPTAPVKTLLGQEELRKRTLGLGQRYRTVLLLVDGRRPLGEVLGMAHKAGAQTSHFEELVRMGLVEVPDTVAAPEPTETLPGALDGPRLTSVELDVYADPALTPMGALLPDVEGDPAFPSTEPPDDVDETVQLLPAVEGASIAQPPAVARPAMAAAATHQPPMVALSAAPRPLDWVKQARETAFKVADHARAAPRMTDAQRLQYVRDLLLDTLRRDSLLFSSFAVGRVRNAASPKELIKLVWELERDRAHPRRNRDQLLNLQRARELLGMGNTLVAGDSQPGNSSGY